MAKTMSTMVDRIATEIRRPSLALPADMTSPIAVAILDSIEFWQKDRFRFNESDPSATPSFNTVQGQWVYTSADNANIGTIFQFDKLIVYVGSTAQPLAKRTPHEIYLLNQQNQQSGQPTDWAYEGNKIIMYPIPSTVWTLFLLGHTLSAAPATLDEDNNPWMNWAEYLIRCQAKFQIATHITRNPTMASQFSPDPDGGPGGKPGETWRAWMRLKKETNKIKQTRGVRAMQF